MSRTKFSFILYLLCFAACLGATTKAHPSLLNEALLGAKPGDYVVLNHQKMFSLLHIFDRQEDAMIIEEISAPSQLLFKIQPNWQNWLDQEAPGHHAWVMYELDLKSLKIQSLYSCSQKTWKKVFPSEQIFPTLLELDFQPVPEQKRKRLGPPMPSEMIDDRPFWNPPVIFEGERVKNAKCQAYFSYWPNDGTELSGKRVEIYLAQEPSYVPHYFPVWMQIIDKFAQAKLRLVDSGQHLISPYKHFPMPPLELSASQKTEKGDLKFHIHAHPQLKNYKVYAKQSHYPLNYELDFQLQMSDNHRNLTFLLPLQELKNKLPANDLYFFIFEPQEALHLSVETPNPLRVQIHD